MNNKAQVSVEYLIMVGLAVLVSVLVTLLALNIFSIKDGIKELIQAYRSSFLLSG